MIEVDDGSSDSLEEVRNWAASSGVPYPVYFDEAGRMCTAYDIHSFPYTLVIGRDGKVVWELRGWLGESGITTMENQVRQALARQ